MVTETHELTRKMDKQLSHVVRLLLFTLLIGCVQALTCGSNDECSDLGRYCKELQFSDRTTGMCHLCPDGLDQCADHPNCLARCFSSTTTVYSTLTAFIDATEGSQSSERYHLGIILTAIVILTVAVILACIVCKIKQWPPWTHVTQLCARNRPSANFELSNQENVNGRPSETASSSTSVPVSLQVARLIVDSDEQAEAAVPMLLNGHLDGQNGHGVRNIQLQQNVHASLHWHRANQDCQHDSAVNMN